MSAVFVTQLHWAQIFFMGFDAYLMILSLIVTKSKARPELLGTKV